MRHALATCSRLESVLERGRGVFCLLGELLRESSGHQTAEEIPDDNPADTTIRFHRAIMRLTRMALTISFGTSPPGFTRQPENSKRAHFRPPALQTHHQNSTKGHPREGRKKENCGGRGKKSAIFLGPPPFEASIHPSGPHPSGPPLFLGLGPNPWGLLRVLHPSGPHSSGPHPPPTCWPQSGTGLNRSGLTGQYLYWPKQAGPKAVLAKLKWYWPKQVKRAGLQRFGLNRSLPTIGLIRKNVHMFFLA